MSFKCENNYDVTSSFFPFGVGAFLLKIPAPPPPPYSEKDEIQQAYGELNKQQSDGSLDNLTNDLKVMNIKGEFTGPTLPSALFGRMSKTQNVILTTWPGSLEQLEILSFID